MDMNKKLFSMMLSLLLGGSIFTGCSDENSVDEPLLRAALTAAGRTYDDEPAVQTRGLGLQFGRMPDVRKPVFGRRILLPPAALLEGMR